MTWEHTVHLSPPSPPSPPLLRVLADNTQEENSCGVTYSPAEGVHDGVEFPHFVLQGVHLGHLPTLGRCHKVPQLGQHAVILGADSREGGVSSQRLETWGLLPPSAQGLPHPPPPRQTAPSYVNIQVQPGQVPHTRLLQKGTQVTLVPTGTLPQPGHRGLSASPDPRARSQSTSLMLTCIILSCAACWKTVLPAS